MKKTLVALAALAVVGAASAQVTLSGGVRAAVQNSGVAAAETTVGTNDVAANNVTITAVEDLGGGMKVTGQYHLRNDIMNGNISAGRTGAVGDSDKFWRNSYLALDASWGQVKAGRWGLSGLYAFDAFGATGTIGPYAGQKAVGARYTNMIQYETPSISGISAQIGTSVDGAAANEDAFYIIVNYSAGPLALRVVSEKSQGVPTPISAAFGSTAAVAAAIVAADIQLTGSALGASYDFGTAKIMGGYSTSKRVLSGATVGDDWHLAVTVPMGAMKFKGGYLKDTAAGTDTAAIGVDYSLSKTALLFADIGKASANANATWQIGIHKMF